MEIEEKKSYFTRFKSFITQSKRVFKITKKPSMTEFKVIMKISGLGIAIIGIVGFIINMIWILVKP
ncbi:MAG: protein translocase SEC61 complex subunit gamma [Nanoarchaeota archaeon]|nr:protein translocase SEC61 complex subunit gamma [Nanoarchaeota archaeon]|tara:strand:+ start:2992 stop:3189 length:198 start_codon:yes stop_codon:yes gene_type:complete